VADSLHRREALVVAEVLSELHAAGSPLATVGPERLRRLVEVMQGHGRLVADFVPRHYRGRMDLVVAGHGLTAAAVRERAGRWAVAVDGPVVVSDVPFEHEHLMHPEPQRQIARGVDLRLRELAETSEGNPTP